MPELWTGEWWNWAISTALLSSASVGTLAFLFQKPIEHWFARGLEKQKVRHAKELEAFRASLIAEAEAVKASQEVRKSAALMFAAKEFEALHALHLLIVGSTTDLIAAAEASLQQRQPIDAARFQPLLQKTADMADALDKARVFMGSIDDEAVIVNLAHGLVQTRKKLFNGSQATCLLTPAEWRAFVDLEFAARKVIERRLQRIRNMD